MNDPLIDVYRQKSRQIPGYFGLVRTEILPLLPPQASRVLEVGCGEGSTLAFLKERGMADWIAGVEIHAEAAARARERLDAVYEGSIETLQLPLAPNSLDVILCLDVLEHLIDPWTTIGRLAPLLKPGGCLIASIPNVRNFRVVLPLLFQGKWEYAETGLLDRTHLRFFVKATAIALLESGGLTVDAILPTGFAGKKKIPLVGKLIFHVFQDILAVQYVMRARKAEVPGG